MDSPLESLMGHKGDPPTCRVFSEDVSVHWWPDSSAVGDRCLCGARIRTELAGGLLDEAAEEGRES